MQPNNNNMHISLPSSETKAAQVMSLLSDIVDQTRCRRSEYCQQEAFSTVLDSAFQMTGDEWQKSCSAKYN